MQGMSSSLEDVQSIWVLEAAPLPGVWLVVTYSCAHAGAEVSSSPSAALNESKRKKPRKSSSPRPSWGIPAGFGPPEEPVVTRRVKKVVVKARPNAAARLQQAGGGQGKGGQDTATGQAGDGSQQQGMPWSQRICIQCGVLKVHPC